MNPIRKNLIKNVSDYQEIVLDDQMKSIEFTVLLVLDLSESTTEILTCIKGALRSLLNILPPCFRVGIVCIDGAFLQLFSFSNSKTDFPHVTRVPMGQDEAPSLEELMLHSSGYFPKLSKSLPMLLKVVDILPCRSGNNNLSQLHLGLQWVSNFTSQNQNLFHILLFSDSQDSQKGPDFSSLANYLVSSGGGICFDSYLFSEGLRAREANSCQILLKICSF
jgi:hypothetical protein